METKTTSDTEAQLHMDPLALGSDVPRSRRQYWTRRIAAATVSLLRLNGTGALATEIAQSIKPVSRIETRYGPMLCRAGHGRLVWRARTFFTEEPDTITWLDRLNERDVLWDVGANVGLYTIYAAKFRHCKVFAFEPEAQNYALLIENLVMNGLRTGVLASNVALADRSGFGTLHFGYVTKGGAYNLFQSREFADAGVPSSAKAAGRDEALGALAQLTYGTTIDDLVLRSGFDPPTHLKVDVDGLEPKIMAGCAEVLKRKELVSVLIEINKGSADDLGVVELLKRHGFRLEIERSIWDTKRGRAREDLIPAANMIFRRD